MDFKELDQKGICVVEADKLIGIYVMNVKELIIADNKMVLELGGQRCDGESENDIKEERKEEFEKSVLPFLKLRPKLHNLTKHELEMRDTRKLKYRPVVDASRTPINPYAHCTVSN